MPNDLPHRGPYTVGLAPALVDGKETTKPWRNNDGSMIIRGTDPDGESGGPVLFVPMIVRAKRGEAWRTSDPAQEAFAKHVVDLLNGAEKV